MATQSKPFISSSSSSSSEQAGRGKGRKNGPELQGRGEDPGASAARAAAIQSDALRALPHSAEAEKGVLSSMLQSPDEAIGETLTRVSENAFHIPAHRTIYSVLVGMHDAGKPVDPVAVQQVLADKKLLEEVGGAATVAELYTFVPTAAHLDFYIEIVKAKDTLRRVIGACTESVTRAYDDQEDVAGLLDEVEQKILAVREQDETTSSMRGMKDQVLDALEVIERMYKDPDSVTGLSTGFADFDEMTNGLHGGEMIIIAARPSMGKTSLVMNIIEHVSVDLNKPSAVFSLEMSSQQLVLRMLCARAQVEMQKLRGGFLSEKRDFPRLTQAADDLAKAKIFIDDTPGLSVLEARAKARRLKKMHDIQLIAVDYLQLLRSTSRRAQDNRQIEIAEISAGLKALAKELDIPIIVLAQLNRNPEQRGGGKPRLSDLRESGSIEQDADVVGLLTRSAYYAEDADEREEREGEAELVIAKQRNGPTGEVPLTFIHKFMRFADRSREKEEF